MIQQAKISFDLIREQDGNCLYVDFENGLIKIEWYGTVGLASTNIMLTLAADLIYAGQCNKMLIDRRQLVEFNLEAQAWMKDQFWPGKKKEFLTLIHKFAAVGAVTPKEGFFDNLISGKIKRFFPWLNDSTFASEEDALDWLL